MFWSVFISWWFLLLVLSLVIRGVATGYLTDNEDGFIYQTSRTPIIAAIVLTITAFEYLPWWMALLIFPIGWIVAFVLRIVLTFVLLPLASSRGMSLVCGILSAALSIGSFILFMISLW